MNICQRIKIKFFAGNASLQHTTSAPVPPIVNLKTMRPLAVDDDLDATIDQLDLPNRAADDVNLSQDDHGASERIAVPGREARALGSV